MNPSFFTAEIAKQRTAEQIAAAEQSRLVRCLKLGAARRKTASSRAAAQPAAKLHAI